MNQTTVGALHRPRILDLFSGAGGAGVGYHRAGFDVTGVDIEPQPNYPYTFRQGDAIAYLATHGHEYDAIHASPPCQGYTTMSNRYRGTGGRADQHAQLISITRALLEHIGKPFVIENVGGARKHMRDVTTLTGGMFELNVDRPRLFETNFPMPSPPRRLPVDSPIGVYGRHHDGRRLWTRKDGTTLRCARTLAEGQAAMGVDWMTWRELCESIPPAYTQWIGERLREHLQERRAA